jgi:hypothetical protein
MVEARARSIMQADFSVELGSEDPTLAVPWSDPEDRFRFVNLRDHPERLSEIEEAKTFPALGEFLLTVNSAVSKFQTAKCDAWFSEDLSEEEEIFGAKCKFVSYVDAFFVSETSRGAFTESEDLARRLLGLLKRAPEMPAAVEAIIRRGHFEDEVGDAVQEGYYFTLYVSGYGDDEQQAQQSWEIGLRLVGNAMVQLSR